jgi:CRP/FNR family cyclic AMP-dependent transcriptional regulator
MRLRRDAKVDLISRAPLFENCSKRELREISSIADEIDLPEGKVLMREGESGREFVVLLDGSVDVTRKGRKLATRGAGDFLGEIALVSNVPRTATVTTASPVRALVVTDRAFRELMRQVPSIQLKVLEALADRVTHDDH